MKINPTHLRSLTGQCRLAHRNVDLVKQQTALENFARCFTDISANSTALIHSLKAKNADYIKTLADQDPAIFSAGLAFANGTCTTFGQDAHKKTEVTIQSVSKLFTDLLARQRNPEQLHRTVGATYTDLTFNAYATIGHSLYHLFDIPHNCNTTTGIGAPFPIPQKMSDASAGSAFDVNTAEGFTRFGLEFNKAVNSSVNYGAILAAYASLEDLSSVEKNNIDVLNIDISQQYVDGLARPIIDILHSMAKTRSENTVEIRTDLQTFIAELEGAANNRELIKKMKRDTSIPDTVDDEKLLHVYTAYCSITMNTQQLTQVAATLSNWGKNPHTNEQTVPEDVLHETLKVVKDTGMYNGTKEFQLRTGNAVTAKSGVGGVILGIYPGQKGIVTLSPPLDEVGNSALGGLMFEQFYRLQQHQHLP